MSGQMSGDAKLDAYLQSVGELKRIAEAPDPEKSVWWQVAIVALIVAAVVTLSFMDDIASDRARKRAAGIATAMGHADVAKMILEVR